MAWQKKNALWWLSIDRYGRQPIAFPCFYPTFHADIALAVTSGPISSQQCDRSTNYNWKWEDKREANREIWKAIGGGGSGYYTDSVDSVRVWWYFQWMSNEQAIKLMHSISPTPTSLYSTGSGRELCPDQSTSPGSNLGDDEKKVVMTINKKVQYSYWRTKKVYNT